MIVGMMRIELRIPGNSSLKGKRQVVKSLIARLHNRYNVSAAEVEDQDVWQTAVVGVVCVTNSARHADEILRHVLAFIEEERLDLDVVSVEREVVHELT